MIYLGGLNPDTKDAVKRKRGRKCWEIVEGMWYHAGYYSTESLRHRGYWAGAEEEEGFIRHVSSCFLLVKVYHPVFTSCVLWTLGTYPLGWLLRKSEPTLCKEAFISSDLEVVGKPKACLHFGSQEGGLSISREWLTGSAQEVGLYGSNQYWSSRGTAEVDRVE